jgi:magnesium transporter
MADIQDSTEFIHRIDHDTKGDNSVRFDELVRLLEHGTDEELNLHLEGFHHSDLADAFGLLDRSLRKRLIESVKEELDPDLLFELEDHLRKEVTDSLTPEEVAEVITEMDSDEAVQVLEDMDEGERAEVLSSVPKEEREDIEVAMWSQSAQTGL